MLSRTFAESRHCCGMNKGITDQLGKGGLLNPVGKTTSKEVISRSERGGKGEKGGLQ
jgi:hypothetical protein